VSPTLGRRAVDSVDEAISIGKPSSIQSTRPFRSENRRRFSRRGHFGLKIAVDSVDGAISIRKSPSI